ncbi:MAG TPA: glycogen synthase GlgA [bacterium]|nr:glycogen synthase GlgA [bacterium]
MARLKIGFVTSEVTPFARTGGLGDVSSALPKYLHGKGHDVRVFVPLYSRIRIDDYDFASVPQVQDVIMRGAPTMPRFSLFAATMPGSSLKVYFVHCPELYDRPGLYTRDADEALRFALLTRAAIESAQRMGWSPQVFHSQDWQSALLPMYLETVYSWDQLFRGTSTVLTIHNIGYQGVFSSTVLPSLGLEEARRHFDAADVREGRINFLKTGIQRADEVTTVSPTYAKEILSETYGMGLHSVLQERREHLSGILNGIDAGVWDPSKDVHLAQRYSVKSLARKEKNKEDLLQRAGLPYTKGIPVFGIVTRLTVQKGIDYLHQPLVEMLQRENVRLVVLASGEARYEELFAGMAARFPQKVAFRRGFDDVLAHKIEGGADFFLMPSLYEPCGLNQMYSLKYGTIPIVRKTGGLADSVELFDRSSKQGTGIVFDHPNTDAVRWALRYALELFTDKTAWKVLVRNAMACNTSWEVQGEKYVELYERVSARAEAKA